MDGVQLVGIVLAAGSSERMGRPKQLLPIRETTMLARVVDAAENSRLDNVLIVTGAHATDVEASVKLHRASFVRNPDHASGNLSSLRAGVAAAGSLAAIVVILGDMPQVDTAIIDAFVQRWQEDQPWAAVASYRHERAHPIMLSPDAVQGIGSLRGAKPLWQYLAGAPPDGVFEVLIDRRRPLDIDTPGDYEAYRVMDAASNPSNSS